MKRLRTLLRLLLFLLGAAGSGRAQELVRVSRVVDADTYEVISQSRRERVRLLGVDAPEQGQPFGPAASDSVRVLLAAAGGLVELTRHGTDLYGRTLGAVRVGFPPTGRLVALDSVLVVRGWAWAYAPGRRRVRWVAEQQRALASGRGLWQCGAAAAVPPWLWRGFNKEIKRRYRMDCPGRALNAQRMGSYFFLFLTFFSYHYGTSDRRNSNQWHRGRRGFRQRRHGAPKAGLE